MRTSGRVFWILTALFWLGVGSIGRAAYLEKQASHSAPSVAAQPAAPPEAPTAAFGAAAATEPSGVGAPAVVADAEHMVQPAELARHNRADDCWMAIGGVVYDITGYLPMHPTDESVMLPWCGKDATQAYRVKPSGQPHSPRADKLLPRYRKGVLAANG